RIHTTCLPSQAPLPSRSTLFPYTTLFRSRELMEVVQPKREGSQLRGQGCREQRPTFVENPVVEREQVVEAGLQVYDAQQGQKRKDRKSTRLNSSHVKISYAVFCLKKKTTA